MARFATGESVAVSCEVRPGAFPGEFLVTVNTLTGPVSGFARAADLVEPTAALHGIVTAARAEAVEVMLSGSFFTTNGLAEIRPDDVRALAA